jgi:hypothetical protein
MNRRDLFQGFAALASGLLVPEPARAYSFLGACPIALEDGLRRLTMELIGGGFGTRTLHGFTLKYWHEPESRAGHLIGIDSHHSDGRPYEMTLALGGFGLQSLDPHGDVAGCLAREGRRFYEHGRYA